MGAPTAVYEVALGGLGIHNSWNTLMSTDDHSSEPPANRMDLTHLRRESRTALELAIVELAPSDMIDRLAVVTGLLEALSELPTDSAPAFTLGPATADRARIALKAWQVWSERRKKHA
jgi:hypothetical protein